MSNAVAFQLVGGGGGTIIDTDGPVSAVRALQETFGDRLDWDDLLEHFEERAAIAQHDGGSPIAEAEAIAAESVRRIVEGHRNGNAR